MLPSVSDTSSGDFVRGIFSMNPHVHPAITSVERRDPAFLDLAVRSPADNGPPSSRAPGSKREINARIRRIVNELFHRQMKSLERSFVITSHFLSSLGAQYITVKHNDQVSRVISKATDVQNARSTYPQEVVIAADSLINLYNRDASKMEKNEALSLNDINSKVTDFTDKLNANVDEAKKEDKRHEDAIVEMMTLSARLWQLETEGMSPDDTDNRNRVRSAIFSTIEPAARAVSTWNWLEKAQRAATEFLELLPLPEKADEQPLLEKSHGTSLKRKARAPRKDDDGPGKVRAIS
ncbi:hypothetical protein H0H93_014536 [Arthromyces matolae]|nr:hypothetical protein H0H93_014536 [Arthromyces matolae]